jgi:NAD(P)-dependent dehydrogenase (short-subunit alcohol dehydrogenase family)
MLEKFKARDEDGTGESTTAMLQSLHPWGRLGRPADIAKAAVYLAGEGASWITGHALVVDGGYTAQ